MIAPANIAAKRRPCLDVVRRDALASPRLLEKIAREGVVIYARAA